MAKLVAQDSVFEGSWYGNDTLWRTVHDLNRILLFADAQGALSERPARRVLHVVDAIVAGEGEGPLEASPVRCGVLLGGGSSLSVDAVAATLMGFDLRRVPVIARGFDPHRLPLGPAGPGSLRIRVGEREVPLDALRHHVGFCFRAAQGWRGHIELPEDSRPRLVESAASIPG
jgi:hypothetical protein